MDYRKLGLWMAALMLMLVLGAPLVADTATAPAPATTTATAPAAAAKAPATWPLPPNESFLQEIPPPPPKDSPQNQVDVAASQSLQANATPAQIAEATEIATNLTVFSFSEALGANFTKANYPQTAAFFKKLDATVNGPKNFIKDHYARVRPYLAHPDKVKQLVPVDSGYSYPSGHVSRAEADALALGYLDPAEKDPALIFVNQVADARVLGGMHYVTDTQASKLLGKLIFEQLMKEPDFVAALNALKAKEWANPPVAAVGAQ